MYICFQIVDDKRSQVAYLLVFLVLLFPACTSIKHARVPIQVAKSECRLTQVSFGLSTTTYNMCRSEAGQLFATPVASGKSKMGVILDAGKIGALGAIGYGLGSIDAGTSITVPGGP